MRREISKVLEEHWGWNQERWRAGSVGERKEFYKSGG